MYNTNTNACTDASNLAVFIQNQNPSSSSHHHHSFLSSGPSSSSPFLGMFSALFFFSCDEILFDISFGDRIVL